jgi:hypothetical protein
MVDLKEVTDEHRVDPEDREVDPNWDTLISNPDYRDAFNRAAEDGHNTQECHIIATAETFDKRTAEEKFDEEEVAEVLKADDPF